MGLRADRRALSRPGWAHDCRCERVVSGPIGFTEAGDFEGTWEGTADETNIEVIGGVAEGIGSWVASPDE